MNVAIINGTNREGNTSIALSNKVRDIILTDDNDVEVVDLQNFKELFIGEHINLANSSGLQKKDLESINKANIIIFVVPTYHGSIPAPLKNFLDIVDDKGIFDNKVFGFIANHTRASYGADETKKVIEAIIDHNKNHSICMPKPTVIDRKNVDVERIVAYLSRAKKFVDSL